MRVFADRLWTRIFTPHTPTRIVCSSLLRGAYEYNRREAGISYFLALARAIFHQSTILATLLASLDEWLPFVERWHYILWEFYSKMQSSYVSISFMQGDVSRMGGTDAGVLPKYKNDIKKIFIDWIQYIFRSIYFVMVRVRKCNKHFR